MDLKDILAFGGMGGLFELISKRQDGLIVKSLIDGKSKFASIRMHDFTPLESVTIYTVSEEDIELKKIFETMKQKSSELPVAHPKKNSSEELRSYFKSIVPDFDEDRVYTSDIKKLIKWYNILDELGKVTIDEPEEITEEPAVEDAEVIEEENEKPEKGTADLSG